jgi:hypothetical protein
MIEKSNSKIATVSFCNEAHCFLSVMGECTINVKQAAPYGTACLLL